MTAQPKPRVAIAGMLHESNTFSSEPTDIPAFQGHGLALGDAIFDEYSTAAHEVGGFIEGGRKHGFELIPTAVGNATPSGTVTDRALDRVVGEIIARLKAAGPLDGVLLALHGAMVVDSYPDGDAEVLRRLRQALGDELPIVVTHDAHANVAPVEIELCTALVIYKEVPHTDQRERGLHAADILAKILYNGAKPTQAIEKPPMVYNIVWHNTNREPMLSLVNEARRLEKENPKILGVSVPVGYQYADAPQMGPSVVVVTDNDPELARGEAKRLAEMMYAHRLVMKLELPEPAEAVRLAMESMETPVVLVELGDNVGGGSAADATFLLTELVKQKATGWVVALCDRAAVELALKAGVNAAFDAEVGGKVDKLHGEPVRITGKVKLLYDGKYVEPAVRHGGRRYQDQGVSAVIECEGSTRDEPNLVLLTTERHMPFSLGQLTSAGIDAARQRILVVKAAVAFRAAYEPIAGKIIEVDTGGLTAVNPARFDYKRIRPGLAGMK